MGDRDRCLDPQLRGGVSSNCGLVPEEAARLQTITPVPRQRQTLRPVTMAITLTSCVMVLAVNWLGVFADIRQTVTVIVGTIGVTSALITWWTLPNG